MSNLPSGTVTFLFTDIEGSTRLMERDPEAMRAALERHHALLRRAFERRQGQVFKTVGDGFCVAFEDAADALQAALDAQRSLHGSDWGALGMLRVRMGLHTGRAEARDGEYLSSLALARVQRVMAAGHGGQILVSADAAARVASRLPNGTALRALGEYKLRGLAETEAIHQLVAADLPSAFPPLRVQDVEAPSTASLRELVRGKLVGRAAEFQQLTRHWDLAQQARGHLVLLSGEPGVGKTRLAQDLIGYAQASGATVLRGGCYEFEATTPYLPFVESFRDWAHWQSIEPLRTLLGATAPEIAKLAPEIDTRLGGVTPNASLSPGEERLRLFDNVARFLQALAAARGLIVFVDDIHWADQGTLTLLHYLLRHLKDQKVLVLAAYREIELDRTHPLAAALVEWNRERLATRIPLGRLSRADTAALLAALFGQDQVSDDFAAALYRETEGNPFFVEEVVKSLIEQGEIFRADGEWNRKAAHDLALPQSLKEAIGRRLTRLAEPTVDALRTAAALGKVFSFRELAAVSTAGEDALLDALDEASGAQLLRAGGPASEAALPGDDAFAFTHDKIREVLYEELNPIRRRRLHQRIGETLEKLYGASARMPPAAGGDPHVQDLAHHFLQAGDLERSAGYLRRAARDAERVFAHDEALKFLEQARESAQALNRAADVASIDETIGDIHQARGVIRPAVESYERALAAAGSREVRAALKAKIGSAYVPIGDPKGLAYLEEAMAELDGRTQANALALATALVGRYYHYRTEHTKAIAFFERARELAEPIGDPATLAQIYRFLSGANQHLVRYSEGDRWARMSIAIGERARHPEVIAAGYEFLAENAFGRGRWDEALAYAAQDREHGSRSGSLARVAWSEYCRVSALHGKGELRPAREAASAALALCDQIGEARLATWLEPCLALVAADLGEDEAARRHAEGGMARAGQMQQQILTASALHALGHVALQQGDAATAIGWFEQFVTLLRGTENRLAHNLMLARAAEAYLEGGRLDEAERLIEEAHTVGELADSRHAVARARSVQARLLASRGQFAEARSAFDDAIATFARLGSRLDLARTLYHRATLLLRDEPDAGQADAQRALELFVAMGAVPDRARVESLLR